VCLLCSVVYEVSEKDYLEFTPLGSGNEVGRSCHILKFKGKTIMVLAVVA
jgi:cleavage and polyadenylation specificity factor subunit 3